MTSVSGKAIDGLVAIGGGSAIGLAKAIALRTDLPQIVLPTTYAGSGDDGRAWRNHGRRQADTARSRIVPEIVIYDADLTMTLPVRAVGHVRHQCDRARRRGPVRARHEPARAADRRGGHRCAGPALPGDRAHARRCRRARATRCTAPGCAAACSAHVDGAASQALPRARRHLRSATFGDTRGAAAARRRIQRAGSAGCDAAHVARAWRCPIQPRRCSIC